MKKFSVKTVVAIGIGAALFFVCGRFIAIPSPVPNTSITIQYGVLAFISALFGPIAGLFAGFIGHALIDASYGWGVWWSWVIASAVCGVILGFGMKGVKIEDGEFGKSGIIRFIIVEVCAHLISWVVIAPVLDIVMYAEPANKVFIQGLVSAAINSVATGIVGSLLLVAYVAAIPKKGSLSEEE